MDTDRRESGKELRGVEGGKTIIMIYYVRKNPSIFKERKKREGLQSPLSNKTQDSKGSYGAFAGHMHHVYYNSGL